MRVTLTDIANYVNVSVSTVSRVLNDHAHVDEQTRDLVRQAAKELNYPLKHLRAPRDGFTVLFLRHDRQPESDYTPSSGVEHALIQGAESVFKQVKTRGYLHSLILDEPYGYGLDLPELRYHGIMLIGGRSTTALLDLIQKEGTPAVVAGAPARHPQIGAVYPDYLDGMRQLVDHLAVQGRRRIGFINGPESTGSSLEKLHGYRLGLTLNDLPFDPNRQAETDFTGNHAEATTRELIARCPDLEAIMFPDDHSAMVGLHVLKSTGRRIPDDIAVTGFHDLHVATYADPPLTTIHDDMHLVGEQAAIRLQQMLDNQDDSSPLRTLVPVRLVIRSSA